MIRKQPYYQKTTMILLGLVLVVYILSKLGNILIPLAFSAMLAILLNPLCNWLLEHKIPRVPAITICILVAIIIFGAIGYFLYSQIASFSDQFPVLKEKCIQLFVRFQTMLDDKLGIDRTKQDQWFADIQGELKPLAGSALGGLAGSLSILLLMPVYAFLFLYYKTLLLNFLYEIFAKDKTKEVEYVLGQTKEAIQHYMFGLLVEAIIVALLNASALWIIGVKYALLIGVMGALLNVLPYIGGIIAIAIPVLIATITKDGFQAQLWIIVSYLIIQFIDNHFLVPYIVSSRVKINALISILIVLMGGALWGISGMFLSIPFIGLLKVIFDRIPELKPWGKLLGDETPTKHIRQINRHTHAPKKLTAKVPE